MKQALYPRATTAGSDPQLHDVNYECSLSQFFLEIQASTKLYIWQSLQITQRNKNTLRAHSPHDVINECSQRASQLDPGAIIMKLLHV